MADDLIKKAWFVVQLFRECDAIQLPHKPTEEVLTGMIDRIEELEAQLQKQSTLMDIGFAEYERRLATARRDAWKEAANFYDNSADFMRDRAAAIRALIAQEEPKT